MTRTKTVAACALGVVALSAAIAILLSAWGPDDVSEADEQLPDRYDDTFEYALGDPVLEIDTRDVHRFADARGLPIPVKRKKKGGVRPALRLMSSSVAVHPFTGDICVLSAGDRVLASFNTSGAVTGYALLDPKLFRQPEGITFMASGDMLIANEGDGKKPTLLLFKWSGVPTSI